MPHTQQVWGSRYTYGPDSTRRWFVWDQQGGRPAEFDGRVLQGLDKMQAETAFRLLERLAATCPNFGRPALPPDYQVSV